MKWIKRLLILGVLGMSIHFLLQPGFKPFVKQQTQTIVALGEKLQQTLEDIPINTANKIATTETTTSSDSDSAGTTTPIAQIVPTGTLASEYAYQFEEDVPQQVQDVFLQAIDKYNATGIVTLSPETQQDSSRSNRVDFYVYHSEATEQTGTLELGLGGPKIYQSALEVINQGRAGINLTNANYSIKLSVAMHELGHALGLDHSESTDSIMYPIDQGKTAFTQEDLAALQKIYA
ncbi:MAG: matrixin family metalloprotease [Enterococcus sp.]